MDQHDNPVGQSSSDATRDRGRRFRSGMLAAGAALGMTLAGLGVAGAQTDATPPTTPPTQEGERPHPDGDCDGRGPGHHGRRLAHFAVAAKAIGVTQDELIAALRSGQSLAQVAESKGVAAQTVIDALVAEAKTALAAKVASGELTQAQADEKAARLTERITDLVNGTGGPRPGMRHIRPGASDSGASGRNSGMHMDPDPTQITL